jgi:hypothetical protein
MEQAVNRHGDRHRWGGRWVGAALALTVAISGCGEQQEQNEPRAEQREAASDAALQPASRAEARKRIGSLNPHGPDDAPNLFESRALGARIHKPEGWVFLPRSALQQDADERITDLAGLWELLGPHWDTPLVSMAPNLEPIPGVDPIVRVFSKPAVPGESQRALRMILDGPLDRLILGQVIDRSRRPDYELVEEPALREIGSGEAATARMRYRPKGARPDEVLIEERLWLIRQGAVYWWIEQIGPAPLSAELDAAFEVIVERIELEPADHRERVGSESHS